MYLAIIVVFVIGYLGIALEHSIKINKTASALLLGVLCWTLLILGTQTIFPSLNLVDSYSFISEELLTHIGEIAEILFFLIGAMTIVEIMDAHEGFSIITDRIKIKKKSSLLIALTLITFFLSALLDNLTTSIVMAAVLRKMIKDKKDLWLFASMVIIAANAGGAWSPIGDVTTIMLWIGGQITASNIITEIFIPSLVAVAIPLAIFSYRLNGDVEITISGSESTGNQLNKASRFEKYLVFFTGVFVLIFVPVFKTWTHLPPFMGVLFGLSVIWILTEILHKKKNDESKKALSISGVIQRIDTPSILFFLGILMAVAALQTGGYLTQLAGLLDANFKSIYVVNTLIGLLSSVIDNVPMVAGAMGMYSMETYPVDSAFWELLAFCAGTGGSILIIGSAAGVAIMGIFKMNFVWYLKKVSLVALLGYLCGILTYMVLN
ncbi:sodium:proton antiporter NhaD [Algibacter sp. L1A34]|uniref:sodium:proton antiporter NhaD n=1 Tax=Algibacter sp. L1A34 TaxID=2686365 RepID=UPI00131D9734|nr:sodium:proton antiporter NhaD [Algibacter sp. L1A34]